MRSGTGNQKALFQLGHGGSRQSSASGAGTVRVVQAIVNHGVAICRRHIYYSNMYVVWAQVIGARPCTKSVLKYFHFRKSLLLR